MTKLFNGCSYSDIWVSPSDWKTTTSKSSLQKQWYVQCVFFDPLFKDKHPKGFQYRRKVNQPKTIQERRILINILIQEIKDSFEIKGFNPITKQYMIAEPEPEKKEFSPETPFIDALEFAFSKMTVADSTYKDIKGIIGKIKVSSQQLRYDTMPVGEIKRKHIRYIIDNLEKTEGEFSGHKFNKYRTYLQSLYNELVDYEVVESNIIKDIRKKKTTKSTTETLSLEERTAVYNHLKPNFPEFLRFSIIYFHSGGRIAEMLRLKTDHVELNKLRYKVLVKKGSGGYKWIYRAIKEISVPYWEEVLKGAKKDLYVFSVGLEPGTTQIRREQINRRWRTHVKEKLGITADFRSLKHSNLDEISAQLSLKDAANAAGHTSTDMVVNHYAVGEKDRAMERIQKMGNEFAPLKAV